MGTELYLLGLDSEREGSSGGEGGQEEGGLAMGGTKGIVLD